MRQPAAPAAAARPARRGRARPRCRGAPGPSRSVSIGRSSSLVQSPALARAGDLDPGRIGRASSRRRPSGTTSLDRSGPEIDPADQGCIRGERGLDLLQRGRLAGEGPVPGLQRLLELQESSPQGARLVSGAASSRRSSSSDRRDWAASLPICSSSRCNWPRGPDLAGPGRDREVPPTDKRKVAAEGGCIRSRTSVPWRHVNQFGIHPPGGPLNDRADSESPRIPPGRRRRPGRRVARRCRRPPPPRRTRATGAFPSARSARRARRSR